MQGRFLKDEIPTSAVKLFPLITVQNVLLLHRIQSHGMGPFYGSVWWWWWWFVSPDDDDEWARDPSPQKRMKGLAATTVVVVVVVAVLATTTDRP